MIQVLEVSGPAVVERPSVGAMEVYAGMRLESGDTISLGEESWLQIKMDEDKYALAEPGSVLRLEASGSSADSKTVIHLEKGAVSNRLENQLSAGSSYEVNTPNSTMAVRGTVFRVEITWNEEGAAIADVSVYGGKVASRLIHPDGTVDSEDQAVEIPDGSMVQVWGDDAYSIYVTRNEKLNMEELKQKTLHFLGEALDAGMELSVSQEELEELIEKMTTQTEPSETAAEPTLEETTESIEETTEPTRAAETYVPAAPAPVAPPATQPTTYTVKFQYGGNLFATQTVSHGGLAKVPTLKPAASGHWNFDFNTAITSNTTIHWTSN